MRPISAPEGEPPPSEAFSGHHEPSNVVIRILSGLCLFMAFWSLIFPASYRVGPGSSTHAETLHNIQQESLNPSNIFTAFRNHLHVRIMHSLVAGVWSLCALHNLQPWLSSWSPKMHRLAGRVFMACSASLIISYLSMEFHGLTHSPGGPTLLPLLPVASWFVVSGGMAWLRARQRRLREHKAWVLRHLGSGLWVAVQRLLLLVLNTADQVMTGFCGWPALGKRAEEDRVLVFCAAALVGVGFCLGLTEWEARRIPQRASSKPQYKAS